MKTLSKTPEHRAHSRKVYAGYRDRRDRLGCVVWVIDGNSGRKLLNPRWELSNHSPTGFEWGYGGNGPAQLALAILAEHLGDDRAALNRYQRFKWACIAQIRSASWSLSSEEIDNCLARLSEQQENIEFSVDGFSQ